MDDFIIQALVAGLFIAAVAGPLGSFVVWRRMSYFGDTLAHSALLGIALAILLDVNMQLAIIVSCLVFAVLLLALERKKSLSTDTLLGILAHSTLAFGLLILSFSSQVQVNLNAYLFGDLLTITRADLTLIIFCTVAVATILFYFWNQFLTLTVHEELAKVEGVAVERLHCLLVILIAVLIAVAMKIIGVLLITSLLIIPPAAARRLASNPEQMAWGASILGCVAVVCGLLLSYFWDTPAGPSIVAAACVLFLILYLSPGQKRRT